MACRNRVDLDNLSAPEQALWQAFPRGELVDLTRARGVRARTIRSEVIAALLLGAVPAEPGRVASIRLDGGRVAGTLSIGHAVIAAPVRLHRCDLQADIDLSGAKTRDIDLEGSSFAGLQAPLAEIDGNLNLADCACDGEIVLTGAHITGALRLQRARLNHPGNVALRGNRLVVDDDLLAHEAVVEGQFRLNAARVGGIVLLDRATFLNAGDRALNGFKLSVGAGFLARAGFSATGEVALRDASIEREVDFRGATLSNPGGNALLATGLQAGTYVRFGDGFAAHGTVRLSRARVGTEIDLSGVRLTCPDGDAVRCRWARATTFTLDSDSSVDGTIDLRHSQFTDIRDRLTCWSQSLRLSGLSYETLDPPLAAAQRVEWLHRDADGYLPQNYETLAAMYRRLGDDASARVVLLAKERERRAQLPWYGRAWSWLQEITVGYGYRPLRATAWLAVFLALGTLVFGLHHPPPLPGTAHPAFNPFIYTVDLLVPLVDLGLRNSYDPQGPQRWLAYFLVAVGWIFVTTIAAGILRVLQRK
ncbi:MAG TPA: hypothetical protein VMG38_24900 [Trebonia sp.]|nr:hypothetical protein [Trebonia sp.]